MKIKIALFILIGFLTSCGYWINPRYVKMSKKVQTEYKAPEFSNLEEFYAERDEYEIYSTTVEKTKDLIKNSDKPYTLLAFYAHWCKFCHENMPKLKEFDSNNHDSINLIFISSSDWLERGEDKAYLERYEVRNKSSLIIDYREYGSEYMNWNRLAAFYQELAPEVYGNSIDSKDLDVGLPHYMLFNNKCELKMESGSPFKNIEFEKLMK